MCFFTRCRQNICRSLPTDSLRLVVKSKLFYSSLLHAMKCFNCTSWHSHFQFSGIEPEIYAIPTNIMKIPSLISRYSLIVLLIAFWGCLGWSIVLPQKAMAGECRPLLEQKCSDCHFVSRVCQKLKKKKGSWFWKRTVKSMIVHGAVLSDGDVKLLVNCLSNPDDTVLNICVSQK